MSFLITTILFGATITLYFMQQQRERNKAGKTLDDFFRQYVPKEDWPDHMKHDEAARLRKAGEQ